MDWPACEVEYENETYCRCHCCDGGIIVYADIHLRPGSGVQNTSDSRHDTCCRRTGRTVRIISSPHGRESPAEYSMKRTGSVLWQMPAQPRCLPVLWHWRTLRGMIMFRFLRMPHPAGSEAGTSERRTVLSGGSSVFPYAEKPQ